jgi:hypothetical protein
MADLQPVTNPAVPNLPLAPDQWDRRYQDQFANVLRLYFNQLRTGLGVVVDNQNELLSQAERDLTIVWISSGEGIFSG